MFTTKYFFTVPVSLVIVLATLTSTARSYFSDDFNNSTVDPVEWQVFKNSGDVFVSSGNISILRSLVASSSFPYVYTKNNIFPDQGAFSIRIRYRFLSVGNFGDGIVVSPGSVPANGVDPDTNLSEYMTFMVWQDLPNGLSFGKILCNQDGTNCNNRSFIRPFTHTPDLNTHDLRIDFTNEGRYLVFLDNNSAPEFTSSKNQKRPKKIWFGNSLFTGSTDFWSSLEIDYIHVLPIEEERRAVVVLPGFGGSWDVGAILTGTAGANWRIPPFVTEYDGVINSLKNAGYEENKDLFIFPFDWRKSLNNLAGDLKNFIDSKNLGSKKIDFIGHSMGGLVARTYLQNYNNPNVNKVVLVGSPSKGIVDAYGLWEGATVWDSVWWQRVLLEIATEVNRLPGETKIQSLRRIAPSVKDLMPVEGFLVANTLLKPWNSLVWKNDYLYSKNLELSPLLSKIISAGSKDYSTKEFINVETPGAEDNIKGLWTDGKPTLNNTFGFAPGDGFVTENSSLSLYSNKLPLVEGHGETISKLENIQKILSTLSIATESAVGSSADNRKKVFVAKLNSPGKVTVCYLNQCNADLGLYFNEVKMVLVPGYSKEKYSITIEANGETGPYQLLVGEIGETGEWKKVDGKLATATQKDNYFYNGETNQLTGDSKTMERMVKLFWNKKLKLSHVYELRKQILEDIDKNMKTKNMAGFNWNIAKWRALDYFVATEGGRERNSEHDDWDDYFKKIKRSRYFSKTNNYYSETLASLLTDKKIRLRGDKLVQETMLRTFMGI